LNKSYIVNKTVFLVKIDNLYFNIKPIYLVILLLLVRPVFGQEQLIINWQKVVGGERNEIAYAGVETTDGGFMVVGSTNSKNTFDVKDSKGFDGSGGNDFWVVKISNTGVLEWTKTYGGTKDDVATGIVKTTNNEYLIIGSTLSTDADANFNGVNGGLMLVRLKLNGDLVSKRLFAGGNNPAESSFQATNSFSKPSIKVLANGQFIVGASRSIGISPSNRYDYYLALLTNTGDTMWEKTYGGGLEDYLNEVIITSDGGYLMVGSTLSLARDIPGAGQGTNDFLVIKSDAAGKELWKKAYGGTSYDVLFAAYENTITKDIYMVGESSSTDGTIGQTIGQKDGMFLKLDKNGNLISKSHFGGMENDGLYSISKGPGEAIYCLGTSASTIGNVKPKGPLTDVWMLVLDSNGSNLLYNKFFGGADIDLARNVIATKTGLFVAASSRSTDGDNKINKGASDFWMINLSNPPPIIFGRFEAVLNPRSEIDLFWTTTYEKNSQYIFVEKSSDNIKYVKIDEPFAADISNVVKNYNFSDKNPVFGKNYYRLRYSDKNGKEYNGPSILFTFAPLGVEPTKKEIGIKTYPNPVEDYLFVESDLTDLKFNLYALNGRAVEIKTLQTESGTHKIILDKKQTPGLYILKMGNSIHTTTKKIIIK
jgi:hypothetical protein